MHSLHKVMKMLTHLTLYSQRIIKHIHHPGLAAANAAPHIQALWRGRFRFKKPKNALFFFDRIIKLMIKIIKIAHGYILLFISGKVFRADGLLVAL